MPNLTTNQTPYLDPNSGSGWPGYIVPGAVSQQGFGNVTTLIYPFFTQVGVNLTSPLGNIMWMYGNTSPSSNQVDVSDYNNFAFQPDMLNTSSTSNGTGSFTLSSSIDGFNWVGEYSINYYPSTTASIYRPSTTGRRRYFLATYSGSGNATGSLYLLAGQ